MMSDAVSTRCALQSVWSGNLYGIFRTLESAERAWDEMGGDRVNFVIVPFAWED